jgi:hypothetical protein
MSKKNSLILFTAVIAIVVMFAVTEASAGFSIRIVPWDDPIVTADSEYPLPADGQDAGAWPWLRKKASPNDPDEWVYAYLGTITVKTPSVSIALMLPASGNWNTLLVDAYPASTLNHIYPPKEGEPGGWNAGNPYTWTLEFVANLTNNATRFWVTAADNKHDGTSWYVDAGKSDSFLEVPDGPSTGIPFGEASFQEFLVGQNSAFCANFVTQQIFSCNDLNTPLVGVPLTDATITITGFPPGQLTKMSEGGMMQVGSNTCFWRNFFGALYYLCE